MRCLVTGNHGYIGYILVHELIKSGHEVVGYDCDYFPRDCFGREDAFVSGKEVKRQIKKDIRDIAPSDFERIDAVIHLAALPNDPPCEAYPEAAEDINHSGVVRVAEAARKAGVERFIFASSCSVFGVKGNDLIDEGDTPCPLTPYGKAKMRAEIDLNGMSSEKFTVTSMRNATCYGISPRMRFDMVLNSLVGYAYTENSIKLLSDGTSWRPIVHVDDVARAYVAALDAPKDEIGGEIISIGTENFVVTDIAKAVNKVIPECRIEHASDMKDPRSYRVSFDKMKRILKVKARWDVYSGAKELYKAYKDYGLTRNSFQNNEFWAGKYFNYLVDKKRVDGSMRIL